MNRSAEIRLAILRDLAHVPDGLLRRDTDIRCRVQLQIVPSPSRAEIETELKELDALRLITGISNKITGEMRWRITDAGQAELSNQ
ncbi:MAG: hypothetical protein KHX31_01290 [Akkermansia sp.]|uniref:hypothetical protein n=1 Tax=Akkermansia sp. TaxID=1872421 RepID=UPI0025B8CF0C|nr:hypothetical protein [Akkermansia sp.]MBS5507247.1 hypothetical protein [Akkermansia sp.]